MKMKMKMKENERIHKMWMSWIDSGVV